MPSAWKAQAKHAGLCRRHDQPCMDAGEACEGIFAFGKNKGGWGRPCPQCKGNSYYVRAGTEPRPYVDRNAFLLLADRTLRNNPHPPAPSPMGLGEGGETAPLSHLCERGDGGVSACRRLQGAALQNKTPSHDGCPVRTVCLGGGGWGWG